MADAEQKMGADPFSQFWTDCFGQFAAAAGGNSSAPAAAPSSQDVGKQAQRLFLDALAKYCDEFMRSDQFLQALKQSMDRSLAFKKQLDQFLANVQRGMQSPARADVDDLADVLRGAEDRILARLDQMERRVAAVEDTRRAGSNAKASSAKRPSRRVLNGGAGARPPKTRRRR